MLPWGPEILGHSGQSRRSIARSSAQPSQPPRTITTAGNRSCTHPPFPKGAAQTNSAEPLRGPAPSGSQSSFNMVKKLCSRAATGPNRTMLIEVHSRSFGWPSNMAGGTMALELHSDAGGILAIFDKDSQDSGSVSHLPSCDNSGRNQLGLAGPSPGPLPESNWYSSQTLRKSASNLPDLLA